MDEFDEEYGHLNEDHKQYRLSMEQFVKHVGGFAAALISNLPNAEVYSEIMALEQSSTLISYLLAFPEHAKFVKELLQKQLGVVGKMLEFMKKNPETSLDERLDFIVPVFKQFHAEVDEIVDKAFKERKPTAATKDFDKEFLKDLKIRMPEANA